MAVEAELVGLKPFPDALTFTMKSTIFLEYICLLLVFTSLRMRSSSAFASMLEKEDHEGQSSIALMSWDSLPCLNWRVV